MLELLAAIWSPQEGSLSEVGLHNTENGAEGGRKKN